MENIFITNLKFILKEKNLTQSQFAKEMGFSNASVSNYLSGQSEPSLSFFQKLKLTYDISLDSFLTKKLDLQEKTTLLERNLTRFIGSYLLYFHDTSFSTSNSDFYQKNPLRYGVLLILPENNTLVSYALFFKDYQTAIEAKNKLDSLNNNFQKIETLSEHQSMLYTGSVEISQTQIFIFLKSFNDQSLIILNNPPSNKTYIGGLGTTNSVSRGREHMPSIQFVLISKDELFLPEGEIFNMLSLKTTNLNMSYQSQKLLTLFKNLYLSENENILALDQNQKNKVFESALESIVSDAIELNMFKFAKISAADDDLYYNLIKKEE